MEAKFPNTEQIIVDYEVACHEPLRPLMFEPPRDGLQRGSCGQKRQQNIG